MSILESYAMVGHRAFYLKVLCEENQIPVRSIVEVGTWKGATAKILRKLFPEAHLYLVDSWDPYPEYIEKGGPCSLDAKDYETCYQKVSKFFEKDPQVSVLRKTSLEGAKEIPDGVDLVFIDADHSYEYVKQDIEIWEKKVRKGGLLAGHDFSPEFPGVMQAVDEAYQGKYLVGQDTVWATIL